MNQVLSLSQRNNIKSDLRGYSCLHQKKKKKKRGWKENDLVLQQRDIEIKPREDALDWIVAPQNPCAEALTSVVMVLGDGAFGRY